MNKSYIAASLAVFGAGNTESNLRPSHYEETGLTTHQTDSESPPGCQASNPWL